MHKNGCKILPIRSGQLSLSLEGRAESSDFDWLLPENPETLNKRKVFM
jgi:hypothetical protein